MNVVGAAPSAAELAEVALTREEYDLAVAKLGRAPLPVELGIIGALWSEHCGYKTSKPLLGRLPTTGPGVLQGPGENAGAVDIGNGLACVFKIESHNHPSAIEPYEGAATGVGGILRDIFTMGARPIALLDSLRFGPLDAPGQRRLLDGVVAGIGGYGNCIGVPTVGGEIVFDESYTWNCLVNAMCVGIIEHAKLTRARASGPGNPVLLVGADTGRDGIHGATFASVELDDEREERRPAVQVGNPFLEKCLMEACLELAGHPHVVAVQDLGAAGLTSAASELAHKGGCGIDIDVAHVARREAGMSAHDVMLSESQERMLLVVDAGHEAEIRAVFEKWELRSDTIGAITDSGNFVIRDGSDVVCDVPLAMLIDEVPLRHPEQVRPTTLDVRLAQTPRVDNKRDDASVLLELLASPNIGSRRSVFRRYDTQVGDDTIIGPGGDAALIRIHGTTTALALSTDGNARHSELDPRRGAAIAVAEAARNVVATGARPLAVTNCLNFGNPEKPEVFWQLAEAIEGISEACTALGAPVVSGNVSLYNDTNGVSIAPTPVIGMVGLLDDVTRRLSAGFCSARDRVVVVGPWRAELGGSEYQRIIEGTNVGPRPELDLKVERAVLEFVLDANAKGMLRSAHDCSDGGLAVALAESALLGETGFTASLGAVPGWAEGDRTAMLFGEAQSRFVLSCGAEALVDLAKLATTHGVALADIGEVGGDAIVIDALNVELAAARAAFDGALDEKD